MGNVVFEFDRAHRKIVLYLNIHSLSYIVHIVIAGKEWFETMARFWLKEERGCHHHFKGSTSKAVCACYVCMFDSTNLSKMGFKKAETWWCTL